MNPKYFKNLKKDLIFSEEVHKIRQVTKHISVDFSTFQMQEHLNILTKKLKTFLKTTEGLQNRHVVALYYRHFNHYNTIRSKISAKNDRYNTSRTQIDAWIDCFNTSRPEIWQKQLILTTKYDF